MKILTTLLLKKQGYRASYDGGPVRMALLRDTVHLITEFVNSILPRWARISRRIEYLFQYLQKQVHFIAIKGK
jgi:hypothetical protein